MFVVVLKTSRVVDRAMSVGLRALCGARAAFIRTHRPSTSSATAVFCSVAVPDVKNCRTSSYLAGRGALVVNCAHSFVFKSLDAYVRPKRRESVQP